MVARSSSRRRRETSSPRTSGPRWRWSTSGLIDLRSLEGPAQRIYQVAGPGLARDFPPPRTGDAPRNNIRLEVTSFVGRDREIEQATRMLDQSSLLTLTGPGGVGKTRIGLRLARVLLDRFEDGTWIVECGNLSDPSFLLPSVVSAIGLPDPAGRSLLSTIVDQLKGKRLLLVLDDCDPVLTAAAELAEGIVRVCSSIRIVVTSREALGVPGEAILPIASLATPETGPAITAEELGSIDACRLFVERARSVQPAFELTDQNARSVAQSAAAWTGSRWRSSSPRLGSGRSRSSRSQHASTTASAS